MTRTIMIECPACNGEGRYETGPWGFCRHTGAPLYDSETCDLCHGSGGIEEHLLPIEEEDLDDMCGD